MPERTYQKLGLAVRFEVAHGAGHGGPASISAACEPAEELVLVNMHLIEIRSFRSGQRALAILGP